MDLETLRIEIEKQKKIKISNTMLAEALGMQLPNVSRKLKTQTELKLRQVKLLENYFNINLEYLSKNDNNDNNTEKYCDNIKVPHIQKKIIEQLGRNVTQTEIATALGLEKSSISAKIRRDVSLTIDEIIKLEKYFHVNLQDSMSVNPEIFYNLPVRDDISASLGFGRDVFSERITEHINFPKSLFKNISASPEHCCIINTNGTSMYPTIIGEQDQIMVDLSQIEIFDGKIYLIRIDNSLFAKRLQKLPQNKIKVISDNKEYDPYIIDLNDESLNFAIIGRVVWISRPL